MKNILVDLKKLGLLILICTILSPFFPYKDIEASLGTPFGGRVVSKQLCTCGSGEYLVTISGIPRSSGTYLYSTLGTKLYAKRNVNPGSYVLGRYNIGGQCLMAGTPCTPIIPTKGTISMIGTSL